MVKENDEMIELINFLKESFFNYFIFCSIILIFFWGLGYALSKFKPFVFSDDEEEEYNEKK